MLCPEFVEIQTGAWTGPDVNVTTVTMQTRSGPPPVLTVRVHAASPGAANVQFSIDDAGGVRASTLSGPVVGVAAVAVTAVQSTSTAVCNVTVAFTSPTHPLGNASAVVPEFGLRGDIVYGFEPGAAIVEGDTGAEFTVLNGSVVRAATGVLSSRHYALVVAAGDSAMSLWIATTATSCPVRLTVSAAQTCGVAVATTPLGPALAAANASIVLGLGVTTLPLAFDSAIANSSVACGAVVTVVDTSPPAVTCRDVVLDSVAGQCGAAASSIPAPAVVDNCAVASVVLSVDGVVLAPGAVVVAVGATLVHVVAADAAGNTATCDAVVTVRDIEGPVLGKILTQTCTCTYYKFL